MTHDLRLCKYVFRVSKTNHSVDLLVMKKNKAQQLSIEVRNNGNAGARDYESTFLSFPIV